MNAKQEEKYLKIRKDVRDLYRNSSMSLNQISRLFRISPTKCSNMIEAKNEPMFMKYRHPTFPEAEIKCITYSLHCPDCGIEHRIDQYTLPEICKCGNKWGGEHS